ncbi:MAG: valine--pyruvate transaminase [Spirochaetia bacterium]
MEWSLFGEKFTQKSGILELMDDLGKAMSGSRKQYMLGGGNPAHLPEMNAVWRRRMEEILAKGNDFEKMIANYDTPQGKTTFLEALAGMLSSTYGWKITEKNIGITNGSQSAFFLLLNMLSGEYKEGKRKKVLFPLAPEYIGYADQSIGTDHFISCRPEIHETDDREFKYYVDFNALPLSDDISAICVSRPTNPTGNVLTNEEISKLSDIAAERGIPLLLDNAYGTPFPNIIFTDAKPVWNENIILGMSLSKLGLPAVRTGIIIAKEEIINALSAVNAIMSLANGSIGQVITQPLIESGELIRLSNEAVKPFYRERSQNALAWIHDSFGSRFPYSVHKSEGSIFLWVWFKDLPITTMQLYQELKKKDVIVVPGKYFFYGLEEPWDHAHQCIRINYAQEPEDVRTGIRIIADTAAGI